MVLTQLVAEIMKRGGKPPSKEHAYAMMAVVLALQVSRLFIPRSLFSRLQHSHVDSLSRRCRYDVLPAIAPRSSRMCL